MHEPVFFAAAVWMLALLGAALGLAVRSRSTLTRILAVDTLVLVLIALLVLVAGSRGEPHLMDAALALAALSFVATLALARFHGDGRPFR